MEPVKEEHYKKLIRNALMESYGPPTASESTHLSGTLNEDRLVNKIISLMKGSELESKGLVLVRDWARYYESTPIPELQKTTKAFSYETRFSHKEGAD
jgi:hypothetical protein